jgi:hypothetical protein
MVTLGENLHMVHVNEEKDPFKKSIQLLTQFSNFEGLEYPLQNPYNPYQHLIMYNDSKSNWGLSTSSKTNMGNSDNG